MSEHPRPLLAAIAGTALLLGACSGSPDGSSSPPLEPTPTSALPPQAGGGTATPDAIVSVDVGRWDDSAAVSTLVAYLEGRQQSMRRHRITAAMVETTTFQWLQQQRREMVEALQRGWTVPARAVMAVQAVRSGAIDAVIRLCLWGPSVDYIDEVTGEPIRAHRPQWYPFDVRLVFAGDRWLVAGAGEGEFECRQEQG